MGCRMSDVGCRMSDLGCRMLDVKSRMSNLGYPMSDLGCWMSDGTYKLPYYPGMLSHQETSSEVVSFSGLYGEFKPFALAHLILCL